MCPPLLNGPHGYGLVAKTLHRVVFVAIAVQFAMGYLLDVDDGGQGRGRGRGAGLRTGLWQGR
ncbi:hypothetical protein [Streptomyces europaeiscabiei]|uniref:hypothetical protein n=1 Tax=Streptomyces europaeiscabiei TaxID=146819 RepID=UPI002E28EF31|nr:hypothetical protein [Streptomyces europaeiscabiei]